MGKIYEALQQANLERNRQDKPMPVVVPEASPVSVRKQELKMEAELSSLYRNIQGLLPDESKNTIQFIGTRAGHGVSTVVCEFAKTAAYKLGKKVLVLDFDMEAPTQHKLFGLKSTPEWEEVVLNCKNSKTVFNRNADSSLFVYSSQCPATDFAVEHGMTKSPQDGLWFMLEGMKERFNLILIDSPPMWSSLDGISVSGKADGVVMVLESGNTSMDEAKDLKRRLIDSGGNVLGVVYCNRRQSVSGFWGAAA